jgi:hypothetical protein
MRCVGDNLGWFTERVNWTPEDFRIQENQVQIPFSEVKYAVTFHWTSDTPSKWKKHKQRERFHSKHVLILQNTCVIYHHAGKPRKQTYPTSS